jgi:hypothetical protein
MVRCGNGKMKFRAIPRAGVIFGGLKLAAELALEFRWYPKRSRRGRCTGPEEVAGYAYKMPVLRVTLVSERLVDSQFSFVGLEIRTILWVGNSGIPSYEKSKEFKLRLGIFV